MAVHLYPSFYRCDCGHESHFSEGTVHEMRQKSQRKRQILGDSERGEHMIEFEHGRAVAMICPRLGRLTIQAQQRKSERPGRGLGGQRLAGAGDADTSSEAAPQTQDARLEDTRE